MSRILLPLAAFAALSLTAIGRSVDPLAPGRDLASLFPESTLLLIEAPGLTALLEQGFEQPLVREVLESPLGQAFGGPAALEAQLATLKELVGYELLPTLARLSSRGAALGLAPRGGQSAWALVLHGDDEELLKRVLMSALDRAATDAGFPNAFDEPSGHVRGADVWYVGEELVIAQRGGLLVASNEGAYGRDVLGLAADASGKGLTSVNAFAEARASSEHALLSAWVDLQAARSGPNGGGEELRDLANLPADPAAQLLLGPNIAGFGSAKRVTAWIELDDDLLSIGMRGHDTADLDVLRTREDTARPPLPSANGDNVAVAHLYRDLAGVLTHRAELFEPDVLPSIAKPISELSVLFSGRDLSESILPGVSPWITLVARPVTFSDGAQPDIQLPGLAGIFLLEEPDVLGPRLTAAFQTLIGITNVERAQQAQDPMVMSLSLEGETSLSRAAFLAPPAGAGVDIRYNLEPACAQVGELFVLGTHAALVRQLVREIANNEMQPASQREEALQVDGTALSAFIQRNYDALVMNKVLEDGVEFEDAEESITGLSLMLDLLSSARVVIDHTRNDTLFTARFKLGSKTEALR